jgi:orotate phosphoribosyltransferase
METPESMREEIMKIRVWRRLKDAMLNNAVSTERELTLASGRKSKFYVDCRLAACHPSVGEHLGGALHFGLDCVTPSGVNWALAPVPLGGLLLVARLMGVGGPFAKKIPWLIPRLDKKGHGRKQSVEGLYDLDGERMVSNDCRVLAIEDVVTSGGSSLKAVETLREENLNVVGVLAVVDRQEGGEELLRENGLQLWSIFRKEDFLPGEE